MITVMGKATSSNRKGRILRLISTILMRKSGINAKRSIKSKANHKRIKTSKRKVRKVKTLSNKNRAYRVYQIGD